LGLITIEKEGQKMSLITDWNPKQAALKEAISKCNRLLENPGDYCLVRIFVLPEFQNKGIASTAIKLCEAEVKNARRWTLDFPVEQPANRHCYEKAGYTDTGRRQEQSGGVIILAIYEKKLYDRGKRDDIFR
jgi:GNAT superfamily N-acetyltransferase